MDSEFAAQALRLAEVAVRVGLNLQAGQRVLIAEPFVLQGVACCAAPLVAAVERAALAAGASGVETIWGDEAEWRRAAAGWPDRDFGARLEVNTERLERAVTDGAALLFLMGSHPRLTEGLSAKAVAGLRAHGAAQYARVAPALLGGATNWSALPAPTPEWAEVAFSDFAAEARLPALWRAVVESCRADVADPVAAWSAHVEKLERRRDELNERRAGTVRLVGPGTDLRLELPVGHRWCTAGLATKEGRRFLPNLPTEEVFTAPEAASAEGYLRVARAVSYGGALIDGIELEFRGGRVVRATATRGAEVLTRLLDTDRGACRLGEVALVPEGTAMARSRRCFLHPLLDENAMHHVALGDAYAFTAGTGAAAAVNQSLVHLDLPVEAEAVLDGTSASPARRPVSIGRRVLALFRGAKPAMAEVKGDLHDAAAPAPRLEDYDWMSVATWRARHAEHVAIARRGCGELLFVGDSITEGWAGNGAAEWTRHFVPLGAVNFGIGGDTTQNVLWRLDHGDVEGLRPRLVVVLIGINNLGRENAAPAATVRGIRAVVAKLGAVFPDARILLQGILPSGLSAFAEIRQRVAAVNRQLLELDSRGGRLVVRDYGEVFLERDGSISAEVMPDGLHLSPEGYRRWAEVLAPMVRALLGASAGES
ncbi:MAG: aminopeptidase [Opitutaceae bacterium]|nr:aminopeptidase [Opitutaceae bacterium]